MDRNALGYLTELNRNVESAVGLLVKLAEYPELNREDFIVYQSYFRESLSDANLVVFEALEDFEHGAMLSANKQRIAFEKRFVIRTIVTSTWLTGKQNCGKKGNHLSSDSSSARENSPKKRGGGMSELVRR